MKKENSNSSSSTESTIFEIKNLLIVFIGKTELNFKLVNKRLDKLEDSFVKLEDSFVKLEDSFVKLEEKVNNLEKNVLENSKAIRLNTGEINKLFMKVNEMSTRLEEIEKAQLVSDQKISQANLDLSNLKIKSSETLQYLKDLDFQVSFIYDKLSNEIDKIKIQAPARRIFKQA